jgi:hypothetical protein
MKRFQRKKKKSWWGKGRGKRKEGKSKRSGVGREG